MPQPCGSLPLEAYSMGGLDAWTDDRKYVADLFVPVRQFAQISQRFRRFLCGRKGSGKSAIAMKARCLSDWDVVHVIQGERRQYGAYMDLVESLAARPSLQINIKRFIQTLWDYVLRVVIMQVLVRYAKSLGLEDHPEAKKALAYLRKRGYYRRGIGNILHQAFEDAMTMLQPGASDPGPANAWLRLMADDEPVCEFENALPDLLGKKRLLIVLDTLESYEINSPAMKDGLRGIVTSIMELTGTEAYDNVGIRLFLPAEIYEDVIHDMPAKITASTVFLRWHYGDLLWLLTRRYLRLLRRTRLLPEQQIVDLDHMVRDCVERAGSGRDRPS